MKHVCKNLLFLKITRTKKWYNYRVRCKKFDFLVLQTMPIWFMERKGQPGSKKALSSTQGLRKVKKNLPNLCHHRLVRGLQRNSARSAMWSEDHSGEGSAVSFLKLSSSRSSNKDSTVKESAERTKWSSLINHMHYL